MSFLHDAANQVFDLDQRLKAMEEQFTEFTYSTLQAVQSILKKNWVTDIQKETNFGLRFGLCVDTKDPQAEGRIRVYISGGDAKDTAVESLPWTPPISVLGGFDDSGVLWVPPAGSKVALFFENGDKGAPYYIGTAWTRDRGPEAVDSTKGVRLWGYGVPEFEQIHQGHRKGYLEGKNDESQVLPPHNTDNANIKDIDDTRAFDTDTRALKDITPSHQYVMKTPEKHRLVFHDGNYFCHHRWKHVELASSGGNTFFMWDDHMHPAKQYANPKCDSSSSSSSSSGGEVPCHKDGDPVEGSGDNPTNATLSCDEGRKNKFANKFFKQESECRPFRGPQTPQNNTCELEQSGVFLSSISGQVFFMDDEVSEPQGIPNWERGTEAFDFGCEDKFLGKMGFITATGHRFHAGDAEDNPNVRSGTFTHPETGRFEPNGFLMETATGNFFEMNDHTISGDSAGEKRGIRLGSTSQHLLEMVDNTNNQKSPDRKEGGEPANNAKQAYVRLKTGYGMHLLMRDDNDQKTTQTQFLELMTPHITNSIKGPNILRMQEAPSGEPGIVFLRAGGVMYGHSTDEWVEQVGTDEEPATKLTKVTENELRVTKGLYVHLSDIEFHHAENHIILAAGRDAPDADGNPNKNPTLHPVVVGRPPFFTCPYTNFTHVGVSQFSERVFASGGPADGPTTVEPQPPQSPEAEEEDAEVEAAIDEAEQQVQIDEGD